MQGTNVAFGPLEAGDINFRQWGIHSYLSAFPLGKKVTVKDLAVVANTTPDTIKNDLTSLQEADLLDDRIAGFITDFPAGKTANP
jgi:DeoR/GlpR family transcriptional regulator of sugar metabolism